MARDLFLPQMRLRELAGRLSPGQTQPSGVHGMALYQRLDDHIYNKVKTAEAVAEAERDPVPNRHAAVHGLVAYDSCQNSINALIMFDFVLQAFSELRRGRQAAEPAASDRHGPSMQASEGLP